MVWISHTQDICIIAILAFLEIALSVDNFAGMRRSLATAPEKSRKLMGSLASLFGLITRIAMVYFIVQLTKHLDPVLANTIFHCGREFLLAFGGLFLVFKAIGDLKQHLGLQKETPPRKLSGGFVPSLLVLVGYDIMLSIDSVVASLSMVNSVLMIASAMVIAHVILHTFWNRIDLFFAERRTMTTLALAFLMLIGVVSIVRGVGLALAEETVIAALFFGLFLELLNGKSIKREKTKPVQSFEYGRNSEPARPRKSKLEARSVRTIEKSEDMKPVQTITTGGERLEEYINLFESSICNNCSNKTFGAFSFCMSCGLSNAETTKLPV